MKFKILTAILAAAIFAIIDPTRDPILLRLIVSLASALMLATVITALASERFVTAMTVLLSVSFFVGTIIDPDPSTYQVLLAFIACPIISAIAIKQGIKHDHQTLVESKKP